MDNPLLGLPVMTLPNIGIYETAGGDIAKKAQSTITEYASGKVIDNIGAEVKDFVINGVILWFAILFIFGGLIVIALSSDAGRNVAKAI